MWNEYGLRWDAKYFWDYAGFNYCRKSPLLALEKAESIKTGLGTGKDTVGIGT